MKIGYSPQSMAERIDKNTAFIENISSNITGYVKITGDTMSGQLILDGKGERLIIKGSTTGSASDAYIAFRDANNTRTGYIGDTSTANSRLIITAESADLELQSTVANVLIKYPRATQAQENHVAALTRKDYVDTKATLSGSTFTGRVIHNYTSSVRIPVGTTSQRGPSEVGSLRYNSTDKTFEGYADGAWGLIGGQSYKFELVTSSKTMVKGKGYMVNTNNTNITLTLPSSPKEGDTVIVGDFSGKAQTNPFKVAGFNGDTIIVDRINVVLRFAYTNAQWKIVSGIGESGVIDNTVVNALKDEITALKQTVELLKRR